MLQFLKLRHGAKWHDGAEAKGLPYVFAKYHPHGKAQTLPSRRYAESVLLAVSFGAYDTTFPHPTQAGFTFCARWTQRLTRDVRRETRTETRRRETMRQCGFANVSSSHVSARLSSRVSRPRAHNLTSPGGLAPPRLGGTPRPTERPRQARPLPLLAGPPWQGDF